MLKTYEGAMPPVEWVQAFFRRLHALYGNRFQTMWQDCDQAETLDAWRLELSRMTIPSIKFALINVTRIYQSWPPTAGEFAALGKNAPIPEAHRPLLPDNSPRDPIPEQARVDIAAALERCKNGVKRNGQVDMREFAASTYREIAGKVEKVPMP